MKLNSLLVLLTSGKTEMLLFSRFSSSSSRHLANDLGIADNLLYLRPKRFMLARLPTTTQEKHILSLFFLFTSSNLVRSYRINKDTMTLFLSPKLPIVSGRSKSSLCCRSRLVICVQFPISFGRCSNWLWATSRVMRLHSSPTERFTTNSDI